MASRPSSELDPWSGRSRPSSLLGGCRLSDPPAVLGSKGFAQGLRRCGFPSISATCSGVPSATTRPPSGAAFGAEVDDPVGGLDHVEVVLDDDDGVPLRREAVEHLEQLADVVEVQAGGGLVEDVERLARALLDQLAGQLDALGLAAGEGRRRLAELEVVEPDVVQRLEHRRRSWGRWRSGRAPPARPCRARRRCSSP